MTAGTVPHLPPDMGLAFAQIRAAKPVTARPLQRLQSLVRWLAARGSQIGVAGNPLLIAAGGAKTLHWYVQPNGIAMTTHRVALVTMSVAGQAIVDVKFPASGSAHTCILSKEPRTWMFLRDDASTTAESESLSINKTSAGADQVLVHGVSLFEMPRRTIAVLPDGYIDPMQPIYDGSAEYTGLGFIGTTLDAIYSSTTRRASLFSWHNPDGGAGASGGSSTSYESVFALNPALLLPKLASGQTSRTLKVSVYAKVTGGTGTVRFTADSGDSVELSITSTSAGWVHGELDVDCDDIDQLDADGGLQGGVRDECAIEQKVTSTYTVTLYAICITDEPG